MKFRDHPALKRKSGMIMCPHNGRAHIVTKRIGRMVSLECLRLYGCMNLLIDACFCPSEMTCMDIPAQCTLAIPAHA
jgi:hypothetical protein